MSAVDNSNRPEGEPEIGTLWAVMSVDEAGREGICAVEMPGLGTMPMITGSAGMVPKLVEMARWQMGESTFHLVTFTRAGHDEIT